MKTPKAEKVRVNISLSSEALKTAKERAEFFGGNLSAYLAHLILTDLHSSSTPQRGTCGATDCATKNTANESLREETAEAAPNRP